MDGKLHKKVNDIATVCILMTAIYVLAMPYLPRIAWLLHHSDTTVPYQGKLAQRTKQTASATKPLPKDNRIVIPSASVDIPILEGNNVSLVNGGGALHKRLWNSSPLDQGNTVIIAHRFTYKSPTGGFYFLDKVSVGDELAVYWEGQEILYKVIETKIVPNTATEVENNTVDRRLTLYTCTPVYSSTHRIVVVAEPTEVI